MSIASEHADLFNGLCAKLEQIGTELSLAAFMGNALKTLLRRQGDAQFLEAIRDAYVARAAGLALADQQQLARSILQVVIELRPEIARAWNEAHPTDPSVVKWRQSDRRKLPEPPPPPPARRRQHPQADTLAADFVRTNVQRRLASFNLNPPQIPSLAYYHERPLFLFDRNFHKVFASFIADILLPLCRPVLMRKAYADITAVLTDPPEAQNLMLLKKRDEIETAILQRLAALAALQHKAEDIIGKAETLETAPDGPAWRTVEIPQSRPRTLTIMGVTLPVGTQTVTRTITVRTDGGRDLSIEEMEALTLFTQFKDMVAAEGVTLPNGCDFQFLQFLLEFDQVKFAQSAKVVTELATHNLTSSDFLINKLRREERLQKGNLSDVLLLILYNDAADRGFGIADLHRFCIETSREPAELLQKRPFLYWEMSRRPYELAFQIRETMRQRLSVNTLEITLRMFFNAWKTLAKSLFAKDMEIALGVIAAFPIVFTGDAHEAHFSKIAERLGEVLTAPAPDYESAILAITGVYSLTLKSGKTAGNRT